MRTPEQFNNWEEAYVACRERDRPIRVQVDGEIGTVYPSGYYRPAPQPPTQGATDDPEHLQSDSMVKT